MKHFDLNIDKILDNWELPHAIRELIANAIDESNITSTRAPEIYHDDSGWWHIKDYGRGLRYQDLTQSENPEKLNNAGVIGKFGIGLKDALATFDRRGAQILLKSRHGDISLARVTKHSFEDIITLHAAVSPPSLPDLVGTDCCIFGVGDEDILAAKRLFLRFSDHAPVEDTKFGSILPRADDGGSIFINGMKVAEEPNFLFSYNITAINASIKRALNRERQNLGRSAYSDRVRSILLASQSSEVASALASNLEALSRGTAHDELAWLDVQEHAVRILNNNRKVLFVSNSEAVARPDLMETAQSTGFQIVAVPENLARKIAGLTDVSGKPVIALQQFIQQHNESFEFVWIEPNSLSEAEKNVWSHRDRILQFIGGRPAVVKDIRISATMQKDQYSSRETKGLWDGAQGWIIIKRSELRSLESFAGILLHEVLHAKFLLSDVSRDFETQLTELCGKLAAVALTQTATSVGLEEKDRRSNFLGSIFSGRLSR